MLCELFQAEARKVVAKLVFLLLLKRKNLFRRWRENKIKNLFCQWQKRFFARSGPKELLCFVICPQKWAKFPTFSCFWLKLFLKNFNEVLLLLATIFFRRWRKRFTNTTKKNNNKFFFELQQQLKNLAGFGSNHFMKFRQRFFKFFRKDFKHYFLSFFINVLHYLNQSLAASRENFCCVFEN